MTRADRQRAESPRGRTWVGWAVGSRAKAQRKAMRQVRLHRYQWALRRGFNEARLERMKPQAGRCDGCDSPSCWTCGKYVR